MGRWVMIHATEPPEWHRIADGYGYIYTITAKLTEQDQTFWTLKWKNL